MSKVFAVVTTCFVLTQITGCMTKPKFGCVSQVTGRNCLPVSTVAKLAEGNLPSPEKNVGAKGLVSRTQYRMQNPIKSQQIDEAYSYALSKVNVGTPVLSPARTIRILFGPYKDEQGDLNTGGFVYVQIASPEWVLAQ